MTPRTVTSRLLCPWDSPGKNTEVGCHLPSPRIEPVSLDFCVSRRILYHCAVRESCWWWFPGKSCWQACDFFFFFFCKVWNRLNIEWASHVALVVKNLPANAEAAGDTGSISGLGRFPWSRKWQPVSVFLPGGSLGQRSLAGCSPWGCGELDRVERLTASEWYLINILRTIL